MIRSALTIAFLSFEAILVLSCGLQQNPVAMMEQRAQGVKTAPPAESEGAVIGQSSSSVTAAGASGFGHAASPDAGDPTSPGLAGAGVGVLAVKMQESAVSLATDAVGKLLEINEDLHAAGSAIFVSPEQVPLERLTGNFDIAIPLALGGQEPDLGKDQVEQGLQLVQVIPSEAEKGSSCQQGNLIVIYHVMNQVHRSSLGLVPNQELHYHGKSVSLRFRGVGHYQAMCVNEASIYQESRAVVLKVEPKEGLVLTEQDKDPNDSQVYRGLDPVVEQLNDLGAAKSEPVEAKKLAATTSDAVTVPAVKLDTPAAQGEAPLASVTEPVEAKKATLDTSAGLPSAEAAQVSEASSASVVVKSTEMSALISPTLESSSTPPSASAASTDSLDKSVVSSSAVVSTGTVSMASSSGTQSATTDEKNVSSASSVSMYFFQSIKSAVQDFFGNTQSNQDSNNENSQKSSNSRQYK